MTDDTPNAASGFHETPLDLEEALARVLLLDGADRDRAVEALLADRPEHAETIRRALDAVGELGLDDNATSKPESASRPSRDFERESIAGRGGMGVVWRARDRTTGRIVALKELRVEYAAGERGRHRFRREVAALARLRHPGLVPIVAFDMDAEAPYYVMEWIDGRSLADVRRQVDGRRPETLTADDFMQAIGEEETQTSAAPSAESESGPATTWIDATLDAVIQVARTLDYVHRHDILHRDVKPSNIMLTADETTRLVDFGLARIGAVGSLTHTGDRLGSIPYMAPELLNGRRDDVDARADVYALGVTLYELLALECPFDGDSAEMTARRIESGDVTPLRAVNPAVSKDLENVCATAMEPERSRRYATMNELIADLVRVRVGEPPHARRRGLWLRLRRAAERRPARFVGMTLGTILVVTSIWWAVDRRHSRRVLDEQITRTTNEQIATNEVAALLDTALEHFTGNRGIPGSEVPDRVIERMKAGLPRLADHPGLAATLATRIARVQTYRGKAHEALPLLEKAYRQAERVELLETPSGHLVRLLLAIAYADLRRADAAEPLLIDLLESTQDSDDEKIRSLRTNVLMVLGNIHLGAGDAVAAERRHRQALEIASATDRFRHHVNLATALRKQGRPREAAKQFDTALRLKTEQGDVEDFELSVILKGSGWAAFNLKDTRDAIEKVKRCLAIRRRLFGDDNPRTLDAELDLVSMSFAVVPSDKIAATLRRVREVVTKSETPLPFDIDYRLERHEAQLAIEQDDSVEAVRRFRALVDRRINEHGETDLSVGPLLGLLGQAHRMASQWDKAHTVLERCLEITRRRLGPDHPDVGVAHYRLARLKCYLGRWKTIDENLSEATRIFAIKGGVPRPLFTEQLQIFGARADRHRGRVSDAVVRLDVLLRGMKLWPKTLALLIGDASAERAMCALVTGHAADGIEIIEDALDIATDPDDRHSALPIVLALCEAAEDEPLDSTKVRRDFAKLERHMGFDNVFVLELRERLSDELDLPPARTKTMTRDASNAGASTRRRDKNDDDAGDPMRDDPK